MSTANVFIWGTALAACGALALWQQGREGALASEIEALARGNGEVQALEKENQALAKRQPTASELEALQVAHADLVRLRAALPTAPGVLLEREPVPTYPVTETGSVFNPKKISTADLKTRSEWRNVGTATPTDAFETHCWAVDSGDVTAYLATLQIDDAARTRAQELLDRMTPDQRAKFGSADQLIAMLYMGGGRTPFAAIKVLEEINRQPGEVVLRTWWQYDDGRMRENTNQVFRQTPDGWRQPVRAQPFEQLLDQLLRTADPMPGVNAKTETRK